AREIIRAVHAGVTDWAAGHRIETIGLRPKVVERVGALTSVAGWGQSRRDSDPKRPVPVSVKTRLGYDAVVIEDWVSVLVEEQPEAISIHGRTDRKSTRLNSSHVAISYAVFCLKKKSEAQ